MPELRLAEVAAACGGRLVGSPEIVVSGASIDSRAVRGGDLFVALPGERVDGHDFAAAAFAAGATAALVSREMPIPEGRALVVASDVPRAMLDLALAVRLREGWRVVAVTGSAGKTTTKEMTGTVLDGTFRAAVSPGNRNNTLGLPEAVLRAPAGLEVFVAECGMSFAGELTSLARALRPDVVAYTIVAPAHLQNFASVDEIETAKEELVVASGPGATCVANADDPRTRAIALRHAGRRILYGIDSPDADVRASDLEPGTDSVRFRLSAGGVSAPVDLPMSGRHNVSNFLAAAAVALSLGVSVDEIAARATKIRPAPHRGERHRLASGALVVDESYNSNPVALLASAEAFGRVPCDGRRIGLIGEMRELGRDSARLHRDCGREIAGFFDEIVAIGGADARALVEGAREGGLAASVTRLLPTPESAAASVVDRLASGDRLLLKGSRGVELERALPVLGISPASSGGH